MRDKPHERLARRPESAVLYHTNFTKFQSKQRRAERGDGRLKAILYSAVLLIAVFVCFKIVPPYVNEYQLTDKMQEQARFAIVNHYTDEQIRDNIFKVAQDLDIETVKREDIKVVATQSVVRISVDYSVPVDFMVYSTELHFTPTSENRSIM
jgi:hypothetical protein